MSKPKRHLEIEEHKTISVHLRAKEQRLLAALLPRRSAVGVRPRLWAAVAASARFEHAQQPGVHGWLDVG